MYKNIKQQSWLVNPLTVMAFSFLILVIFVLVTLTWQNYQTQQQTTVKVEAPCK